MIIPAVRVTIAGSRQKSSTQSVVLPPGHEIRFCCLGRLNSTPEMKWYESGYAWRLLHLAVAAGMFDNVSDSSPTDIFL